MFVFRVAVKNKKWHIPNGEETDHTGYPRALCNVFLGQSKEIEKALFDEKKKELCPSCVMQSYKNGIVEININPGK